MIRNEKEYRHAAIRLSELEDELRKLSLGRAAERDKIASAVIDVVRLQIEDIEREISEYEDLKEGRLLSFGADDLDSLGELITRRALPGALPRPGSANCLA